ncbi:MAG: hypothetical protein B7Z10_06435, partial [Rhodobacterales bacterium 32-66-7]
MEHSMRLFPAVALALALSPPVHAQSLTELSAEAPMPPEIMASLTDQLAEDEVLDFVRRWEGDITGDAIPDQLVQAAMVGKEGGNAWWLRHYIFIGGEGGFPAFFPLNLDDGIISAAVV